MHAEERIKCMESFAAIKIKQDDFFHKNLEKIAEHYSNYTNYFVNVINSLFKIGYDDPKSSKIILEFAEKSLLPIA